MKTRYFVAYMAVWILVGAWLPVQSAEPPARQAPTSELVIYANSPAPFTEIVRVKHDGSIVWADTKTVLAYLNNPKSPLRALVQRLWAGDGCN